MALIMVLLIYFIQFFDKVLTDCNTNSEKDRKNTQVYCQNWKDIDSRVLPKWYDSAKIGIFVHWGLYSIPSLVDEWFWEKWTTGNTEINKYMAKMHGEDFKYKDFAAMFTAEFYNPNDWAELFNKSGAKYVVLTSKHHDGYALFPSNSSKGFNSVDTGPKKDIVKTLSDAVRQVDMKFGVYYSLYEWFNPIYIHERDVNFTTDEYAQIKVWPDIKQLVNEYKPDVLWSDGDWEASYKYWRSTELLAWLYNESPVKDQIVVNDRWGKGTHCTHGGFYNCEDRYKPDKVMRHKWENAFSLDKKSWGFRRNVPFSDIMNSIELIKEVVSTVSLGGNALINVGPTKEGTIAPIFQERLLQLGQWLTINGEAIYSTSPWNHQRDSHNPNVWYTCKRREYNQDNPVAMPTEFDELKAIYAIFFGWPDEDTLKCYDLYSHVEMGGYVFDLIGHAGYENLHWVRWEGEVRVSLPHVMNVTGSHPAWVLRIRKKSN